MLTSRERILRAMDGKPTDRVPISAYELVGYDSHNICNRDESYRPLMDYIRQYTDCLAMWEPRSSQQMMLTAVPVSIEQRSETLEDGTVTHNTLQVGGRTLTSTYRVIKDVYTLWRPEHWCKNTQDVDALMSIPYEPVSYDFSDFPRIKQEVGERGVIMSSLSDPAYSAMDLMEFGESMVWVMTETDHFAGVVEKLHERNMINLTRMLDEQVVDVYRICGPEYLTPPYLPPRFFERFVVPYVRDMVDLIHGRGGRVRLHCHGRIGQVAEMIVATGAIATDPCEAPPDGDITLAALKRKVGDRLCLFGNLQLKLLEHGTAEEVRAAVIDCMESAKAGGRYVIQPTACPINTPLRQKTIDNYKVFIDTALEYGVY